MLRKFVALGILVVLATTLAVRGDVSAQVAPQFTTRPIFSTNGLAIVVFTGGSVDQLEAAAQTAGASGVWIQDPSGAYQLLVVGGPSFLKDTLKSKMPGGVSILAVTLIRATPTVAAPAVFVPLHPVPSSAQLAGVPALIGSPNTGCEGPGPRVCLVVVGAAPGVPVDEIVAYYSTLLGSKVGMLPPILLRARAGSDAVVDDQRAQLWAGGVFHLVGDAYPQLYQDKDVTLIILTGHDLRLEARPDWTYAFGSIAINASGGGGWGLVSDARMDEAAYGGSSNPPVLERRLHAMIGKYVGLMYLGLQPSNDPSSPVYNSILSPADLDGMSALPVAK